MKDITYGECHYVLGIVTDLENHDSGKPLTKDIFDSFQDEDKKLVFDYMRMKG
jgi:hypothetical protein